MANENVTAPVDGQAFVDYELLLPTGVIGLSNNLVRFEAAQVKETVYGYGFTNLTIRTLSTDYADRVLKALEASGSPLVRFRFGMGVPNRVLWTPWQLHYVRKYSGFFEGVGPTAGHLINLNTHDTLSRVDRSSKTSAHRGKVSDIVKNIAERNGIKDCVIEPTSTEGLWIQSYIGDFEFVRNRLVRIARSERGRGNYLLFVRDNVLHFHTVDYQAEVKDFAYYNSAGGKLEMIDNLQERIDMGSGGVRLIGHDPYTGQSQEVASNADEAIRFANWISKIGSVAAIQRNFPFHLSENRGLEALHLAQNTYEAARAETYQLKLETTKTKPMRAGDILNINLDPKSGQASAWTGLWLVAAANHQIVKSEIVSVYNLQRGELAALKGVSNALTSQGINVVEDEQNAPGYDLSLQQTQVSQLTKGAGKSVGSGVFLTVQDRSKAVEPPPSLTQPT